MRFIALASQKIITFSRWSLLSTMSGLLAGLAASAFLLALDWATETRHFHSHSLWGLPAAGFLIGWADHRFGLQGFKGHQLILNELKNPKSILPFRLAPLVLFGTLLTHFFGGSAGREGTVVQMGASLSDQLNRIFKLSETERRVLLMAGMGAGFGAAMGAPWAGAIFALEIIRKDRVRFFAAYPCVVASFVSHYVTKQLGVVHSQFFEIQIPHMQIHIFFFIVLAGVLFGLAARIFISITHFLELQFVRIIRYPPLRPLCGGILLLIFYYLEGSFRYTGLGIPFIQQAFKEVAGFSDPLYKTLFTSLTLGAGFKGGEFVPLVFIGATLGSALSTILPVAYQLLAAVGFVGVFAGSAKVPLTCAVMAMELFGANIGPYAILACFTSYLFSGNGGIYSVQVQADNKDIRSATKLVQLQGAFGHIINRIRSRK